VRHSLGYRDLVDEQSDFQWQCSKNKILHKIFIKNTKQHEKGRQETPKVRKSIPRVSKSEPKGTKSIAKGCQKWAEREPRGAKSEPKGDPNASKSRPSEKDRQNGRRAQVSPDHFGSHFPLKIDEQINAKIDGEKVMKLDEKSMRKWSYLLILFEKGVHEERIFRKRWMYGNHMNPGVECVSARVRPKNKNRENKKHLTTNTKRGREKGMEQIWKNIK